MFLRQNHHKRLVPIVRQEGFDMSRVHPALGKTNWLFFKEENDFDTAFQSLVETLNTDLAHCKEHTRLLIKALEWQKKEHRIDLLLRGQELEEAIQWLTRNADQEPHSTQLQRDYINTSRLQVTAEQQAKLKHEASVRKRITRALVGTTSALVIAVGLGITSFHQYRRAENQRQVAQLSAVEAQITSANALLGSKQPFDALVEILGAASRFQSSSQKPNLLQAKLTTILHQTISSVQEQNRLVGHDNYWATAVSFSPDGNHIASAGMDGTLKLWSISGELLHTLSGHEAGVYDLSFSPDGTTIASASYDGSVKLWTLDGQLLQTRNDHEQRVTSVRFSPDGKTLATSSDDRTIRLFDLMNRRSHLLTGHTRGVHSLDWSPDGNQLVSIDYDGIIKRWSKEGTSLATSAPLADNANFLPRVSFRRDGKAIFTTTAATTVTEWNLDFEASRTLEGDGYLVSSFEQSLDGRLIAIAGEGNSLDGGSAISLYDLDGNQLAELRGHVARINDLSFSSNGKILASAAFDGTVRLWNLDTYEPQRLLGHVEAARTVTFSSDGTRLASVADDGTARIWDIDSQTELQLASSNHGSISEVSFSPDGQQMAAGHTNGTVTFYEVGTDRSQSLSVHQSSVRSLHFSQNADYLIASSEDGTVHIMDSTGEILKTRRQSGQDIYLARLSPDGKTAAFIFNTDLGSQLVLWRWQTDKIFNSQKLVGGFGGGSFKVADMAFNADGSILGTTSWEGIVHLWNDQAEAITSFFAGNDGPVRTLSFSPENPFLAASSGGFIRLWTLQGEEVQKFYDQQRVHDISFSPQGNLIAAANADGSITLFDLNFEDLVNQGCQQIASYLKKHSEIAASLDICTHWSNAVLPMPAAP